MGVGARIAGVAGAAVAMAWGGAAPAGAGPAPAQNHRVEETHEFSLPGTATSCTVRVFTDVWDDGFGYTSTRIVEDQGADDPCLGNVTMDVRYVEEGGGEEHLVVRGPGGASVEVSDVAEPYPSRSFRVEHTVYFATCDCTTTYTTNPK
jgi:hypothetical protein